MTGRFVETLLEDCKLASHDSRTDRITEILRAWCSAADRISFAIAALAALEEIETEMVAEAALADLRGGMPGAPFDGVMDEAWRWADMASAGELRAYAWVAFHKMPLTSRQRFLAAIYAEQHGAAA